MQAMNAHVKSRIGLLVTLAALGAIVGGNLWSQGVPLKPDVQEGAGSIEVQKSRSTKEALLTTLPRAAQGPERSLILGVSNWAPPTGQHVDPDAAKSLRGYYGSYFNVNALDGDVLVLSNTVYIWPQDSWHATGLIRNQSSESVQIERLTVKLFGSSGEILDVATATVSVGEIRPGEPAPFEVITSVSRSSVSDISWKAEYVPSLTAFRNFEVEIYQSAKVDDGVHYLLSGSIRNLMETKTPNTRVVAAWLDSEGRVLYIASPRIQSIGENQGQLDWEVDLREGGIGNFYYETNEPELISLLSQARFALWGISK